MDSTKVGEVQAKYYEACSTADQLQSAIQHAKEEAFSRRLCLKSHGIDTDDYLIPKVWKSGNDSDDALEHRELIKWLAEKVDVSSETVYAVDDERFVGDYRVKMGRMVCWPVRGGKQKLSVPEELRADIVSILVATRMRGCTLDRDVVDFAEHWTLLGAEALVAADAEEGVPAIFLVHNETAKSVVIAEWPCFEVLTKRGLDFTRHFQQRATGSEVKAVAWPCVDSRKTSQPEVDEEPRPVVVCKGDRVEVRYEGQWFPGVVWRVEGNVVSVQCDADRPGLITIVSAVHVRVRPEA